jgi:hypothetical protein
VWESLTEEQRADIDARILAGEILDSILRIMKACGLSLREAANLNRTRYDQLRLERGAEFACNEEEYWSGYCECPFDAMDRDL